MKTSEIREKYLKFFEKRGHKIIPPAPLVLENDPTTLFTSSGMQPLVPYLMGEKHPEGKRLVDSQPSIRTQDIEEVGDNRHTTFFEMLGNWSLGDYFKKEQLSWIWEFLTEELKLPKEKLYVSIFEGLPAQAGNKEIPRDKESYDIWLSLGVSPDHIFEYDVTKNWWSRSGVPENMPAGEIGGPDSEIFFEFTGVKHDKKFGEKCHPNCDCGRFSEIGNSVFIQYKKKEDGSLEELPQKNVDFGGGFERLAVVVNNEPDVFLSDLFSTLAKELEIQVGKKYQEDEPSFRIIADHIRAAVFLADARVIPSNKQHGYVMRRLIIRAVVKTRKLKGGVIAANIFGDLVGEIVNVYKGVYFKNSDVDLLKQIIFEEVERFNKTLEKGYKEIQKIDKIDGKIAFDLYQSYGFPLEITLEIAQEKGQKVDVEEFKKAFEEHQERSRSQSAGVFKGGLADHSEEVTRLHTAHHLLLASLQKLIDLNIRQKGSNITLERMRMDFNFDRKLTEEEVKQVEDLINQKVEEALPVTKKIMPKAEAEKIGAQMEFSKNYPDNVSVYFVGPEEDSFSAEFCGGPHVANTSEIGRVKIIKQERVGAGLIRIYATASK